MDIRCTNEDEFCEQLAMEWKYRQHEDSDHGAIFTGPDGVSYHTYYLDFSYFLRIDNPEVPEISHNHMEWRDDVDIEMSNYVDIITGIAPISEWVFLT